ncbi:hypothetical protein TNCV_4248171 [Trichonephila clavipes]|nr:hypothetical protein TNCV_4248171 [Trichonephila clavipes]
MEERRKESVNDKFPTNMTARYEEKASHRFSPRVTQQPMRSRPTVPISVYVTIGHEQMSRSGSQSEAKPPVFSPKESLVLIYRSAERMKD